MKSIELLVEKSKNDIIILDALYQWADNPTAMTAIKRYGYTPNHNLIKSNIEVRYNLEPKEIDEIFKKLKQAIEESGFDFNKDHIEIGYVIREKIEKKYGEVLRKSTLERLNNATENEKYVVWLYCQKRQENRYYVSLGEEFEALLIATFNLSNIDYIKTLIKIGFINAIDWVKSKKEFNRETSYKFPKYLEPICFEIDKYVELPELPDYKSYVDALFDKKVIEALICLDEILFVGSYRSKSLSRPKPYCKLLPHPYLISKGENYIAINYRIYELFKEYFYNKKREELRIKGDIEKVLTKLLEKHYPMLSISEKEHGLFNSCRLWIVDSYDKSLLESEILIILAPWLTGEDIEYLNEYYLRYKSALIILTFAGIPDLFKLYKEIYHHSINDSNLNWIILDLSKGKVHELIVGDKPVIFDEIKEGIKTLLNVEYQPVTQKKYDISPKVDLRVESTKLKREIVVEGDSDEIFFRAIVNRLFNCEIEDIGWGITIAGKDKDVSIVVAALSSKKEIEKVVMARDFDDKSLEQIVKSVENAVRYKIEKIDEKTLKVLKTGSIIKVSPLGLKNDNMLKDIGSKTGEMEDYILKLMIVDENVKRWFGKDLKEVMNAAKKAKLGFNLAKSKGIVQLCAYEKKISYEEFIEKVINLASLENLKSVTKDLQPLFHGLDEIGKG